MKRNRRARVIICSFLFNKPNHSASTTQIYDAVNGRMGKTQNEVNNIVARTKAIKKHGEDWRLDVHVYQNFLQEILEGTSSPEVKKIAEKDMEKL